MTTITTIQPLTEADLPSADRTHRLAFGTFLGMPDPTTCFGDADYITTRWRANPSTALGAFRDDELVGSNFVTIWGSVGFFGPLTVRPDLWDQSIAQQLLAATVVLLDEHGVQWAGLFTFAHSPKHVGLYQRFGFWPQHLTAILTHPVTPPAVAPRWSALSQTADAKAAVAACAEVTNKIYGGLDVGCEIHAVVDQRLGETVLVHDGDQLEAFAVCHLGAGSEAGSGNCYAKVAAVRPGPAAANTFARLLDACQDLAAQGGATTLIVGINTARHEAYTDLLKYGFRTQMHGVVMTRPNSPGYNKAGVYLIDDWR